MKGTILEKIVLSKRERVESEKRRRGDRRVDELAGKARDGRTTRRFFDAINSSSRINVIAEFKRASPSRGLINSAADPAEMARQFERYGAAAISVLTEEDHFLGSLDDLTSVRSAVSLPVLRKDFIIDEYQIFESAAAGADAILLIAAVLSPGQITEYLECASACMLDTIVEVHNVQEMEIAVEAGADTIGVNNRDLKTFSVDLDVSRQLIASAPAGVAMISESGIRTAAEIRELNDLGYSAFLIGETLMKSEGLGENLIDFIEQDVRFPEPK